jgi:hypothetical protein
LRKLQAVNLKESLLERTVTRGLDKESEPQGKRRVDDEDQQEELRLRKKGLEVRFVAQMASVKEERGEPDYYDLDEAREKVSEQIRGYG